MDMIYTHWIMDHVAVFNLWPSLGTFAADLGIAYGTAKAMRRRGKIPAEYWVAVVTAAQMRDIAGVTLEVLAEAVAIQPSSEAAE